MFSSKRAAALACLLAVLAAPSWATDKARARRSYEKALELFLGGDFKHSLDELNNSISDDSSQMVAYALRARVWNAVDNAAETRRDAERAVKRSAGSVSSMLNARANAST